MRRAGRYCLERVYADPDDARFEIYRLHYPSDPEPLRAEKTP